MSEIIIAPPGTIATGPQFGLQVTSAQPIRLERLIPGGPVTAFGSIGDDIVTAASTSDLTIFTLLGDVGNDILAAGAGNDIIDGGLGNDTISGGAGDDLILGDRGNDVAMGGSGNDLILAASGNDIVFAGDGDDEIRGGLGDDIISGEGGNDIIFGSSGDDRITGGEGDDVINPGGGRDVMTGGPGADTFRFEARSTGRQIRDRITDFTPDEDVIQLSKSLLPGANLPDGELNQANFRVVRAINDLSSSERAAIVYDRSTGLVYYNPNTGREIPLFRLPRNLDISAADFEIF